MTGSVTPKLYRLGVLTGWHLMASDGEAGKLHDVYFDDQDWTVRHFVVATGNLLLGADVLLQPEQMARIDEESRALVVDLSRDQVEHCPPARDALPVSRHYELNYRSHSGLNTEWIDEATTEHESDLRNTAMGEFKEPRFPHLRSSKEVTGYYIHAADGEIGHVVDFLIEGASWKIRYLEVDTRNWLPGKHVLVSPAWITGIDWVKREVEVNLTTAAIRSAPPYRRSELISRDYQVALYRHYGMSFHGQ